MGVALFVLLLSLLAPAGAASGYSSKLKRYPYLTDVVGSSATVNWATDRSSTSGKVRFGKVSQGSCTTTSKTASRTSITVNSVSEYQWKAQITVQPDTQYCYRVYLDTTDLLGSDPAPPFFSQVPAGSGKPFSFAVFGDWGSIDSANQNTHQANLHQEIADSGARFAVTTGDQPHQGATQTNWGDLTYNRSLVFGPRFWAVPGRSVPIFPALGNHGLSSTYFDNFPQSQAVAASGGRYQMDTWCCPNGAASTSEPSAWYAFDAGDARFYVLETAWDRANVGTGTIYENDYEQHWTPTSAQYQWLQQDLATHASQVKFAFFHFPLYSDSIAQESDTYLQGEASLEGLLRRHGVDIAFTSHAHLYERNVAQSGLVTYISGGGGAQDLAAVNGCSSFDAFALGWSTSKNAGSSCNAPLPLSQQQVYHFLLVTVNGTTVTVAPTDELGRVFDVATYDFTPAPSADLSLTQSDRPDPGTVGRTLTYTLTAMNAGPSPASGVTLTDNLPPGVRYESATASQGSCTEAAGTVTCELGGLASEASATVEIVVTPQSEGTISNTATITATETDPASADNTAGEQTVVGPPASDLSITQTDSPDPVGVAQPLTYTVTVANAGPTEATGVTLTDSLPIGVRYESAAPSEGSCAEAAGTVTCDLGSLSSGASATVEVRATAETEGAVVNTASVQGNEPDPDTGDNTVAESTTVAAPSADLSLAMSDSPDPVMLGQTLTYTLTARNDGPSAATGVALTDSLPLSVAFQSASASQGACAQLVTGSVSCDLGSLDSGATATIQIAVTVGVRGAISNGASIAAREADPAVANNQASAGTTVHQTLTFTPTADAYVRADLPSSTAGSATSLQIDNSPVKHALMKFAVSGIGTGTVVSAKLRVFCIDSSLGSGGDFYRVNDTSWSETTVRWNTAPAADPTRLATLGRVTAGRWYEVDLTPLIARDGPASLRVTSSSADGADYHSKETTSGLGPQLVVTVR